MSYESIMIEEVNQKLDKMDELMSPQTPAEILETRDLTYLSPENWGGSLSIEDQENLAKHARLIGPPVIPGTSTFDPVHIQGQIAANFTAVKNAIKKRFAGSGINEVGTGMYMSLVFGGNCYCEGSSGTGKTAVMREIASIIDAPIAEFNASADASDFSILGGEIPVQGGQYVFRRGPLLKPGALAFMVDELPRLPAQASNVLLQAMAEREIRVPLVATGKGDHKILLSPSFYVQGVGNPVGYGGQGIRSEALFDRFAVGLTMPHPDSKARLKMYHGVQNSVQPNPMVVGNNNHMPTKVIPGYTFREAHAVLRHSFISDDLLKRICAVSYAISPLAFRNQVRWDHCDYYDEIKDDLTKSKRNSLKELTELVETHLYEGSNPRGEIAFVINARILALLDSKTEYENEKFIVTFDHIREAFKISNRSRLKTLPGSENEVENILEKAIDVFL